MQRRSIWRDGGIVNGNGDGIWFMMSGGTFPGIV